MCCSGWVLSGMLLGPGVRKTSTKSEDMVSGVGFTEIGEKSQMQNQQDRAT